MILRIQRSLVSLCNGNLQKPFPICQSMLFFSTYESQKLRSPVSISDYLTDRLNFSEETALKVSTYRSRLKDPERADSLVDFLKDVGFSPTQLESVLLTAPFLIFSSIDNIRPKIKVFEEAGFSHSDIVEIISQHPGVLARSANRILPSIMALKSFVGSFGDVSKILRGWGWFLKTDPYKILIPNVEMMESCGISSRQIARYLGIFPRVFLVKPERLKGFIDKVDGMGVERGSLTFLIAVHVVSSMSPESWELKLGFFRSLGFSEEEIVSIFRKAPLALTVSGKKLKEVFRVLIEMGGADKAYLAARPNLLRLSVERRLKPRIRVMRILERNNLLKRKPHLSSICVISEKEFFNKYILPYLDVVGDAYGAVTVSQSTEQ